MTRSTLFSLSFSVIHVTLVLGAFQSADPLHLNITDRQSVCAGSCNFNFCNLNPNFDPIPNGPRTLLRGPNFALGGIVCNAANNMANIRTREALVSKARSGDPFVPISQYSPQGLGRPFQKNYLKLVKVPFLNKQAVARGKILGNQNRFSNDLCVIMPLRQYQLLRNDGTVRRTVRTNNPADCVTFRTLAPRLLIELVWENSDDLDVSLLEPTGFLLSRFNPDSPSGGRLFRDNGFNACGLFRVSKETIRYLADSVPPRGEYTVRVAHFENCLAGPTSWVLRVTVNGVVRLRRSGSSNRDVRQRITSATFTI